MRDFLISKKVIDFFSRCHFKLNLIITARPGFLNMLGLSLSVIDKFGTMGDTLLTATVCRNLKKIYPRIKINCVTPNPELLKYDPGIDCLNKKETFFTLPVWYLDILESKDPDKNVLKGVFDHLGIKNYEYRAKYYLSNEEVAEAKERVRNIKSPFITINTVSREKTKEWPAECWQELISRLSKDGLSVVQLGDNKELHIVGAVRFADTLSPRQSVAVLSLAKLHIGCVSFLMHAASGVDVPAVIIYGGRETPFNSGYDENYNIYMKTECSPCWVHTSFGQSCPYDTKCMKMIAPDAVYHKVRDLLAR